jgi:hypothetical protein
MSAPAPALLDALHDAIATERRLIDELISQMRGQRSALCVDDLQAINDSTFATHRILATLRLGRERQRYLQLLLGDPGDDRLSIARQQLRQTTNLLAHELSATRRFLRESVAG